MTLILTMGQHTVDQYIVQTEIAMKKLYQWSTRIGLFYIAEHNGRFHPMYDDQSLGSYATPQQAAEDLAGGYTFSISSGVDTGTLGIPDDVSEWERLVAPPRQLNRSTDNKS
jgi:hypothetical protein